MAHGTGGSLREASGEAVSLAQFMAIMFFMWAMQKEHDGNGAWSLVFTTLSWFFVVVALYEMLT